MVKLHVVLPYIVLVITYQVEVEVVALERAPDKLLALLTKTLISIKLTVMSIKQGKTRYLYYYSQSKVQ